jgi:hypothetical protein
LIDRYLTDDLPERDGDLFEEHLETCRHCRKRLPVGVELQRARLGILDRVEVRPRQGASSSLWHGPVLAVAAAVAVFALAAPLLFVNDVDQDLSNIPAPLPPASVASSEPFVLTFELDSGDVGWLLWSNQSTWTAARLTPGTSGATVRYRVGSSGPDAYSLDTGDDSIITDEMLSAARQGLGGDSAGISVRLLAADPDIPWAQLTSTDSPADQWDSLTDDTEMTETLADNPLAASAAAVGTEVAEFSHDGRLVAWGGYKATALEHRVVTEIELESFTGSVTTGYAAHLAANAALVVRSAFSDALITLAEYQAAANAAIACVEAAGGEATFSPPEPGRTGVIRLGDHPQCGTDTFEPVNALWRLQINADGPESIDMAQAITEGNTPRLEMLAVEPGPAFDLASGVDWQIKIASRGAGWCVYELTPGGTGTYCALASEWVVPNLVDLGVEEDDGGEEGLLGVTAERVSSVVVRFANGSVERIETQGTDDVDVRGFGIVYEIDTTGIPETLELYNSANELTHTLDLLELSSLGSNSSP